MIGPGAFAERLAAARAGFAELAPAVTGRAWPLASHFGTEPESSWGPPEVLAHVAEMLPFWRGELERVLAGANDPNHPTPFGRIADDPLRIGVIGRDRTLPAAELLRRIDAGAGDWQARLTTLGEQDLARVGRHEKLGEMTAHAIAERFVVAHLEEHVAQLRSLLDA